MAKGKGKKLTCLISRDCRFQDRLHPFANNSSLIRAEEVCLLAIVVDPESITASIQGLVYSDPVAHNVNESRWASLLHNNEIGPLQ